MTRGLLLPDFKRASSGAPVLCCTRQRSSHCLCLRWENTAKRRKRAKKKNDRASAMLARFCYPLVFKPQSFSDLSVGCWSCECSSHHEAVLRFWCGLGVVRADHISCSHVSLWLPAARSGGQRYSIRSSARALGKCLGTFHGSHLLTQVRLPVFADAVANIFIIYAVLECFSHRGSKDLFIKTCTHASYNFLFE